MSDDATKHDHPSRPRVRADEAARDAEAAAEEYRRALFDYTQLMRHRLRNPLTAITAGLTTLVDHSLDRNVELEVLNAMIEQAQVLQSALLNPYTIGEEEAALHPLPIIEAATGTATHETHVEAGTVESHFRTLNEDMIMYLRHDLPDRTIEFLCECSAEKCHAPLRMLLSDYLSIHLNVEQFVIKPLHHYPDVEDVLKRTPEWWVTRKIGVAADIAREIGLHRHGE